MSTPPPRPARRPLRTRLVAAVVVLVVLAGGLYLTGYLLAGDRLPRQAVISGVSVGGLSRTEAIQRLTEELTPRADAPISVVVGDAQAKVKPQQAGLSVDLAASVDAAGAGRSADPRHVLSVLTGGGPTDAVVVSDQERLEQAVARLADDLDREPADARIAIDGTKVVRSAAKPGLAVQRDDAATALRDGLLGEQPVTLPAKVLPPKVTDAEADTVAADVARPAVSGPVTVSVERAGSFSLTPTMIGRALSFVAQDGTLAPRLDGDQLREATADAIDGLSLTRARNATVRIAGGEPRVVPAVDGTVIGADVLAQAVQPVLTRTGKARTAVVPLTTERAEFSTADAEKLGVQRVTGEFTTYFPYANYRNVNLARAAEKIDNTLLKPGDTFSLNKVVGERTKANGFTEGYIISGDKFTKELGGGVSQSATTTFNAMFFAGLEDVQHQPHTLYIDRYPAGREATVAWPSLDLRFTNDTRFGVLVQASVKKAAPGGRGSITVKMWSTKTYDKVSSSALKRSNYTTGTDVVSRAADCEPQQPVPGFDVDYQRIFSRDGSVVKREGFHWRYAPTNRVTCR